MRSPRRAILAVLTVIVGWEGCAYQQQLLYQPPRVVVSGTQDVAALGRAIRKTLEGRGWVVQQPTPGVIEARQIKRDYWASIRVTYDARGAEVRYADSRNLNYSSAGGAERIHSHYNVWIRNVEKDLRNALGD